MVESCGLIVERLPIVLVVVLLLVLEQISQTNSRARRRTGSKDREHSFQTTPALGCVSHQLSTINSFS
jgi:hypothetical protein